MNEFKKGEWVITPYNNVPFRFNPPYNYPIEELKLWEPELGEWCWYTRNGSFIKCLEYVQSDKFDGCYLHGGDVTAYVEDCEPFIGELPSFLKRRNK